MSQIRLILMCLLGFLFLGPGSAASCPSPRDKSAPALEPAGVVADGCIKSMPATADAMQTSLAASVHHSTIAVGVDDQNFATCRANSVSDLEEVTVKTCATFDPLHTTWSERPFSVTANDAAADAQLASLQH